MIWMTWRQFRVPALAGGGLLAVLLAGLAMTWAQVSDLAAAAGYDGCAADACAVAAANFLDLLQPEVASQVHQAVIIALVLLPTLLGIFWGAPLVARELETGTYRMVFSQSVSRGRWLLVKLLVAGLAAALGVGLLSLVLSRWAALIDAASADRLNPLVFAARGLVPVGYALLAFVIGVTAGLLLRRTLPAMAVTLLVVAGLQLAGPLLVRPALASPVTETVPLNLDGRFGLSMDGSTKEIEVRVEPDIRGAWVIENDVVTATGATFKAVTDPALCGPEAPRDHETCPGWLKAQNLSQRLVYVPGEQFWALQWREFGLLVALAGGLSAFSVWWIRRRLI
jgi:hypothetical protein